MKVIHVSAELWPWAKVGGLGDAVSSMVRILAKKCSLTIFIPHYSVLYIPRSAKKKSQKIKGNTEYTTWLWEKCHVIAVRDLSDDDFFINDGVYPLKNITEAYLRFCQNVHAYLKGSFDVLHLHDWHAAYLAHLSPKKTILHVHNLSFQGKIPIKNSLGLSKSFKKNTLHTDRKKKHYNLLKNGIKNARKVIFVSPSYSKETLQKKYGCGLSYVLRKCRSKIFGVLNGIDYNDWDPNRDIYIQKKFAEQSSFKELCSAKLANKKDLLSQYKKKLNGPLYVIITRLTLQKGTALIVKFMDYCIKNNISCFLLGSLSHTSSDAQFLNLQKRAKESSTVHIALEYDESLSHKLYASGDYILIPSRFEPCGLVQMIAMRYGTIPIAKATGGLADTIIDDENGYLFHYNRFSSLLKTLKKINKTPNEKVMMGAFKSRFTWKKSAQEILTFYNEIVLTSS